MVRRSLPEKHDSEETIEVCIKFNSRQGNGGEISKTRNPERNGTISSQRVTRKAKQAIKSISAG